MRFPKEHKANTVLCDEAFPLLKKEPFRAQYKYNEASSNGSARGAFMSGIVSSLAAHIRKEKGVPYEVYGTSAKHMLNLAHQRKYPIASGYLAMLYAGMDEFVEPDYDKAWHFINDGINNEDPIALYCAMRAYNRGDEMFLRKPPKTDYNKVIDYGKRCASHYRQLPAEDSPNMHDREISNVTKAHILNAVAVVAGTLYGESNHKYNPRDAVAYATFGSNHGSEKCSAILAYIFCDFDRVVPKNLVLAKRYVQRAIAQGMDENDANLKLIISNIAQYENEQHEIDNAKREILFETKRSQQESKQSALDVAGDLYWRGLDWFERNQDKLKW